MKRQILTGLFLLYFTLVQKPVWGQSEEDFVWPNGAKAALCLTYDDGLPSHVNTVVPMLNKYNFKATFFPTLTSPSLYDEVEKWKSLAKNGHELGNHTVYHPCQKSMMGMEWVKDHQDLDKYTIEQVFDEIKLANSFLQAIDGKKDHTFAYPCAHQYAGGKSYKDSLHLYATAARWSAMDQEELASIEQIDLYQITSWAPDQHGANDLIAYIEKVIKANTLSTITFHGVNAEHMIVTKDAHEKMLQFLDDHRDEIWVTTFKEATDYLRLKRGK
ncbi:MAG: polysaccharide deacetylase family protein [Reichenbachiella sp.]|uniref:polysaccharide deacetylase family protein n=1 Tax=Reichenbachiella sp. TaxID=2184521 RepID=UPI003267445B